MKSANLGDVFEYRGRIFKVVAVNEGYRSLFIEPIDNKICKCCGRSEQFDVIESSPMFQNYSEPIKTIRSIK